MYNNPLTTIKQTQGVANVNTHFERSKSLQADCNKTVEGGQKCNTYNKIGRLLKNKKCYDAIWAG